MAGTGAVSAIWNSTVVVALAMAMISLNLRSRHGTQGKVDRIFSVVFLALIVLSLTSCVSTVAVWRAERRRWPSIDKLPASRGLIVWSWVAGAVVALGIVTWLFHRDAPSVLLVEFTALAMGRLWGRYDGRQRDHLFLQLASIDASAAGMVQSAIRWEHDES